MEQKLDPEFKRKWVEALRSGEFVQGEGYLENEGKFCCLGVLCKVAGLPTTGTDEDDETGKEYEVPMEFIPKKQSVLRVIPEWLCESEEIAEQLAEMNDGKKQDRIAPKPFPEIADWIESNL